MAGRRHAADELAVARLVQPQVELVRRADAQDLAADDVVGAEATASVDLALALAVLERLALRLQEHDHVLARHDTHRRRSPLHRHAHGVGEVGCVDVFALEFVAEIEHRQQRRLPQVAPRFGKPRGR